MSSTFDAADFALNPNIDTERLRRDFAEHGVVQVAPFLSSDTAQRMRDHLISREDWSRSIRTVVPTPFEVDLAAGTMSVAQVQALEQLAAPGMEADLRYIYDRIIVVGENAEPVEKVTLLADFARFLASRVVRDLIASVTTAEEIGFVDVQATRYTSGQFLTAHADTKTGSDRLFAYVLGLSEPWRAEWGGVLLFHEADGNIARGLVPQMNVLTIFSVPRSHSVSLVGPFAPKPRYSITGWYHQSCR